MLASELNYSFPKPNTCSTWQVRKKNPKTYNKQESLWDAIGSTGKGLQLLCLAALVPRALQLTWH